MKTVFYLLFVGLLCVSCTNRRVDNAPKQTPPTEKVQTKSIKRVYEPPYDNSLLANKETVYYKNLRYVEKNIVGYSDSLAFKSFSIRENEGVVIKFYTSSASPLKRDQLEGLCYVRNTKENEIKSQFPGYDKMTELRPKMINTVSFFRYFLDDEIDQMNNVVDVYLRVGDAPVLVCTIPCINGRTLKVKR